MDREQMIIHMIRDYYPNDTSGDEELKEAIAKGGYANIVRFFDLGYRKIPEGAVVLTREEMEMTDKIPQKIKEFYKWFIEIEKEQACKEKAAEILNKIANIDDCGFPMKSYVWFNEIAKENGVEVE